MRVSSILLSAALLTLPAVAVQAGNPSLVDGKAEWHSTSCKEPVMPASLVGADKETSGSDMNKLMESYNAYSGAMQAYMNCVSKEAETDQNTTSQVIMQSAQGIIQEAQKKVMTLHDTLQSKQ